MSQKTLIDQYGPLWHIDPPPIATPLIEEGFLDVTDPAPDAPLIALQVAPQENAVLVIQRIKAAYFDYSTDDQQMVQCPPACSVGRLSYAPAISDRIVGSTGTQLIRQDGYYGATPPAPPIEPTSKPGLSYADETHVKEAPFIVPEGKTFQIVLTMLDNSKGLPIPEGYRRSFYVKVTGFELVTV